MNIFQKTIAISTVVLMTGCATDKEFIVKEVKVPLPIPCNIIAPQKPAMPSDGLKKDEMDIYVWIKTLLAEIEIRKGYEIQLEVAVTACNSK